MVVTTCSPSRHDQRIARILSRSHALGRPLSLDYLDSCDVRVLPVILAQLETRRSHDGQRRFRLFGK